MIIIIQKRLQLCERELVLSARAVDSQCGISDYANEPKSVSTRDPLTESTVAIIPNYLTISRPRSSNLFSIITRSYI